MISIELSPVIIGYKLMELNKMSSEIKEKFTKIAIANQTNLTIILEVG